MLKVGYKFSPTDEEIVSHYLRKFLDGEDNGLGDLSHMISVVDVYSMEPWQLPLNDGSLTKKYSYFITKRKKISKKNENGKRSIRSVYGDDDNNLAGGFWRMSNEKPIKDKNNNNNVIGYMSSLCFHRYANKQRQRKEAVKTDWLMDEYRLAGVGDAFQEWVLCRIKCNAKSKACDQATAAFINGGAHHHQQPISSTNGNFINGNGNGYGYDHPNDQTSAYFVDVTGDEELCSLDGIINNTTTTTQLEQTNSALQDFDLSSYTYADLMNMNAIDLDDVDSYLNFDSMPSFEL